jgi:NAD(P)-dependent dehydrogenase (short-subunit alcohol dehydrogenase family)
MTGMRERKVAIVTGAASGIGRASAIALAAANFSLVLADVDPRACDVAYSIMSSGGKAIDMVADITKDCDMAAMVDLTVSRYGGLDVAVNVAGGGDRRGPIPTLSEDDFEVMIGLNLKGTFLAMRRQLAYMVKQGTGGSVINIASTAALRGVRDSALYSAAKHGVLGLTRCAALDHAQAQIRVNAICPGAIQTPQFEKVLRLKLPDDDHDAALAEMGARYPLGRIGVPEDVAALVAWLASDASAYLTGQALAVDGGFTA